MKLWMVVIILGGCFLLQASAADESVFFERRVRPLLIEHCYSCHSADASEVKGGLRLDSRRGVEAGGENGPVIVAGDPDASRLISAVERRGELQMPPKRTLTGQEVAQLRRWVEQGAHWPEARATTEQAGDHWAFKPIRTPDIPNDSRWGDHPIDRFLHRRLQREGMTPSKPAKKSTLIRRAYIDLLGLPPTLDAINRFLADEKPDAYPRLIDELLGRREYGERWARHWLDVARYSDTKGYVDGGERRYPFAYTYRDYVIWAFNDDLPFDQFVMQQVAGDLVGEGGDNSALAALGFLTIGNRFNFFPREVVDDRIDVVTRGFMGLTVSCARCHDHKYDPITADDYYGLYGVFASSREPSPHEMPLLEAGREDGPEIIRELKNKGKTYEQHRLGLQRQIQREMRGWVKDYLVYLVETTPAHRTLSQPPLRTDRGVLREESAYARGGVIRWRQYIERSGESDPVFGLWNRAIKETRDKVGGVVKRWRTDHVWRGEVNALLAMRVEEAKPGSMVELAGVYGQLLESVDSDWLKRVKEQPGIVRFEESAREQLRQVLYGEGGPATVGLEEAEDILLLDESVEYRKHFANVERVYLKAGDVQPRAMVMLDRPEPIEPRVLVRGDPNRPGRFVPRRFIRMLSDVDDKVFTEGSGRLALSGALVHENNPLTARVIVNRVWNWHFGRPLVLTMSDFGVRSTPPSHPELLDYLASRFRDEGWSLKALHRLIMTSNAYQQRSEDRAHCSKVDPENRLLWKMNRTRMDFETMRDSMLAVSGELKERGAGRPEEKAFDDPANHYRTVYGLVDRELLPSVMRVFDFPSPDLSSAGRAETTVPQQTLFLLNSPFMLARAEALVKRLSASQSLDDRVILLHRYVYGRDPSREERVMAREFLDSGGVETEPLTLLSSHPWVQGYGRYDAEKKELSGFEVLPHNTGDSWQGSASYPDAALHYLRLTATGGHVGIDSEHAAVRRWVSPFDGEVRFHGELSHGKEDCGDGVEAWVVFNGNAELGHWRVYKSEQLTEGDSIEVKVGDYIDFVVSLQADHFCDDFIWAPSVVRGEGEEMREWKTADAFEFDGARAGLSLWVQYAQVLLQSNEFLFVD